jgi:hypothetical protein
MRDLRRRELIEPGVHDHELSPSLRQLAVSATFSRTSKAGARHDRKEPSPRALGC